MPIIYSISRRSEGGLAEVHMRFYHGRSCDLRARTRVYVPIINWNSKEGRCNISRRYDSAENTQAREAQAILDELAERVLERYAKSGGRASKEWLQRIIDGAIEEQPLADIIDRYCEAKDFSARSRYKMHSLRMHILRYERKVGRRLCAHTITTDDLHGFVKHLRGAGVSNNTIANRLRQLRALVYYGGRPYPNPFDTFDMPQEVYGAPSFLTPEERERIEQYDKLQPSKRAQRDIFVFQCYTGCRVSDLYNLTHDNIKDGWLIYTPHKTERSTGTTVEIPLPDKIVALAERYKGIDHQGRLFPFIADIHYNRAIRYILQEVGIDRPVMWRDPKTGHSRPRPLYEIATSHLARRTFAQIAYSSTGDKRLVASMTGHSENSRAFNRYSEVTREMKKKALGI